MKTIKIPQSATVTVTTPNGVANAEISFFQFAQSCFDTCEQYNGGIAAIRKCNKILDQLEKAGETVDLEDEHYDALKAAVEGGKFANGVARQMLSFYEVFD